MPYLAVCIDPEAGPILTVEESVNHISTVGLIIAMKEEDVEKILY